MTLATNLGFPRIGAHRELKRALEACWAGTSDHLALRDTARRLRADGWSRQHAAGLDTVPCGDFSLYDHVLDTAVLVGAVPPRYRALAARAESDGGGELATYFAMARGLQDGRLDVPALEMTKWFDTNYHYLVPELYPGMTFELAGDAPIEAFIAATLRGVVPRPVLLGPLSFLLLGKPAGGGDPTLLGDRLLPVYQPLPLPLRRPRRVFGTPRRPQPYRRRR